VVTVVTIDVANRVDDLCLLIARTDALVSLAEGLCKDEIQIQDQEGRRRFECLTHLVTVAAETVRVAREISGELALCLAQASNGA
jgi:hypothetical protein